MFKRILENLRKRKDRIDPDPAITDPLGKKILSINCKLADAFESGALQVNWYSQNLRTSNWLLNPPASEETVKLVESHLGVSLPTDYRRFVLEAGDGGAGPYSGLLPLRWRNPATTAVSASPADGDNKWISVSLCLLPFSCTGDCYLTEWNWVLLALNGPMTGRVYHYGIGTRSEPVIHVTKHPDFTSWYEDWLDMIIRQEDTNYFGFDSKPEKHHH